jgi:acyl-homoserine lactone acylase PvdQ
VDIATVVGMLLGTGGTLFVAAVFRGITSLRSGARAREKEAVDDLGRWRDDLDNRARAAERDRDYWCRVANRYAAQLIRHSIDPDPADPVPPSERG